MVDLKSTEVLKMKEMSVDISDGESFFAHELSINFNPVQFFFDFKCVTPRVDMRNKSRPTLNIKHNVVLADPYHTKQILKLLSRVVENYEKEFGEIKKPKSIETAEKKREKLSKDNPKDEKSTPSYFG